MKLHTFVTMLGCLLALGGCITVSEPLADTDASLDDFLSGHPPANPGQGAGAGGSISADGTGGNPGFDSPAGEGGGSDAVGGSPAPLAVPCQDGTSNPCTASAPDASVGVNCLDGTSNPCSPIEGPAGPDASAMSPARWLGTQSQGCTHLDGTTLCMGEGWMLTDNESIPDCGHSGAYRICSFESNACVSHTVMMVQRCD